MRVRNETVRHLNTMHALHTEFTVPEYAQHLGINVNEARNLMKRYFKAGLLSTRVIVREIVMAKPYRPGETCMRTQRVTTYELTDEGRKYVSETVAVRTRAYRNMFSMANSIFNVAAG